MKAYYTAPIDSVTDLPNVVRYRCGHPSHGVHVGTDALIAALDYAKQHGLRVFELVEVDPATRPETNHD